MRIDPHIRRLVREALAEDLGRRGDITTKSFLPLGKRYRARIVFKEAGILCGKDVFNEVFRQVCRSARVRWKGGDGRRFRAGAVAAQIIGPREIMTAERTALNFLQTLSGIATFAGRFAHEARGTRARVYDTRKTLPGWRRLSKYAVKTGGGFNHRMGLYDMALLKDNHLAGSDIGTLKTRIAAFRRRYRGVKIQAEASNLRELGLVLSLRPEFVLLDNMGAVSLRKAIRTIRRRAPRVKIEISGGVDLKSLRRLAKLGADRISVGKITHSAPALDISMQLL